MEKEQHEILAWYMRGGTSKGLYFLKSDLPQERNKWEPLLLDIMGSPDPNEKQMNGMGGILSIASPPYSIPFTSGGGFSSSSKVIVVWPLEENEEGGESEEREEREKKEERRKCHVAYAHGQVSIREKLMDWSGNCGNLTSAVAAFAIERGLIKPSKSDIEKRLMSVELWQSQLNQRVTLEQPLDANGRPQYEGDFYIDGISFPAAPIKISYHLGGVASMFPTNKRIDTYRVPDQFSHLIASADKTIAMTCIYAGNPLVIIKASALGLQGTETQNELEAYPAMFECLEDIRAQGSVLMGFSSSREEAKAKGAFPKITFFSNFSSSEDSSENSIVARLIALHRVHHAYPGSAAVGLSCASIIPGTLITESKREDISLGETSEVVILHTSGKLVTSLVIKPNAETKEKLNPTINLTMMRSAKRIMRGYLSSKIL